MRLFSSVGALNIMAQNPMLHMGIFIILELTYVHRSEVKHTDDEATIVCLDTIASSE